MIKIAICEDEKTYSDKLITLLNEYFEKTELKMSIPFILTESL